MDSGGSDGIATVIGRRVELTDTPYEIVGVLPASFRVPLGKIDMVRPLPPPSPPRPDSVRSVILSVLARIRPGVSIEFSGNGS